ncbi:hypothetical protein SAY87_001090 [Trapa incisa]|uniref:Uncharacterized protein n=1 Tax=Trapa incisa TaxID=236973 RepID=A0AAN7GJX8_9MYRT|nr:hypothetical protein SAY87_001090 [Trapa incisa]
MVCKHNVIIFHLAVEECPASKTETSKLQAPSVSGLKAAVEEQYRRIKENAKTYLMYGLPT